MGDWRALLPFPSPFTLWRTTCTLSLYLLGRSVGEARGCGGGGREQSSSISRFLGNSGTLSALKQIVHILSSFERLFHSVISNSVHISNNNGSELSIFVYSNIIPKVRCPTNKILFRIYLTYFLIFCCCQWVNLCIQFLGHAHAVTTTVATSNINHYTNRPRIGSINTACHLFTCSNHYSSH